MTNVPAPTPTPMDLRSPEAAAVHINRSLRTLARLVESGVVPAYDVAGRRMYSLADLDAYVRPRRSGGA